MEFVLSGGRYATRLHSCYSNCLFCGAPRALSSCQAKPKTHTHTGEKERGMHAAGKWKRERRDGFLRQFDMTAIPSSLLRVTSSLRLGCLSFHPSPWFPRSLACIRPAVGGEWTVRLSKPAEPLISVSSSFNSTHFIAPQSMPCWLNTPLRGSEVHSMSGLGKLDFKQTRM